MKAIRIHEFGGVEVLQLEEVARPVPKADEILVRMYTSGVNPADYIVRQGGNELLKPLLKLPLGLGLDGAGVVEETGSEVTGFAKGDKVYGIPNFLQETYAEFIAAKANQFAFMPRNLSFAEAGAIPSCALMAWDGINLSNVQAGQRVLVHGAAGGIGTLALQMAKAKGAYVIGTASQPNLNFIRDLGADEALDYRQPDFARRLSELDVVFDASPVPSEDTRLHLAAALKEGGSFVTVQIAFPFSEVFTEALASKHAAGKMISQQVNAAQALADITTSIEAGNIKVVLSKVYPLAQAAEAHKAIETQHVRGKIALEIRKE